MLWKNTLTLAGLTGLAFVAGCHTTSNRPAYAVQPAAAAAPAPCATAPCATAAPGCNQPVPGAAYAPATTIPAAPPPPGVLSR